MWLTRNSVLGVTILCLTNSTLLAEGKQIPPPWTQALPHSDPQTRTPVTPPIPRQSCPPVSVDISGMAGTDLVISDSSNNLLRVNSDQHIELDIPCTSQYQPTIEQQPENPTQSCQIKQISVRQFRILCKDEEPPTVIKTSPVSGALNIDKNTVITVQFSEDIVPATVSPQSITVHQELPIETRVTFDSLTNTATIQPRYPLTLERTYRVKLSNDIIDWSGNQLEPFEWQFTVRNWSWRQPDN